MWASFKQWTLSFKHFDRVMEDATESSKKDGLKKKTILEAINWQRQRPSETIDYARE